MAPPGLPFASATPQPTEARPSQPTVAAESAPQLTLPACSFTKGRAPQVASYCMSVRLDPEAKTVSGVERITYRNPSQDSLSEVWLRLYLHAFRDLDSVWMRESGGQHRGTHFDPDALGDITVEKLTLASGVDLLAGATLTDTLMRVPLPQPIGPNQSIDLDVNWLSKLPRVFARTGYGGRDDTFFMVAQWYPKMAVYNRGRWDTEPWHGNSEFFADFGGYDVTISTPKEYVVAGVGVPKGDPDDQGDTKLLRYTAVDVTDFAFAASPDFKIETAKTGGVEVLLYYLPEHQSTVSEYMGAATGSLQAYSSWYGAYPHARLTVVDVPESARDAGGMEYPTLITGGGRLPGLVVAHEVGHQWWPMQTATNESLEPWLDEGLTEYSGIRYMDETRHMVSFDNVPLDMRAFEHSRYNQVRRPATLPAWRYTGADYGLAVYGKTALGLWTLERVVGTAAFRRAMAEYLAEYRFKHPTGADFRAVLERSLGDQSWFFDDYMNGTGVIAYVADPIETTASGSIAHVRRVGDVRAPVEIRITLADGTQQIKTWDGQTKDISFTFPAGNPVKKVEIDPEDKLKAEKDRINNVKSATP